MCVCMYTHFLLTHSTLLVWGACAAPVSPSWDLFICQLPNLPFICSSLMNGESLLVHKFIKNSGTSDLSPQLLLLRCAALQYTMSFIYPTNRVRKQPTHPTPPPHCSVTASNWHSPCLFGNLSRLASIASIGDLPTEHSTQHCVYVTFVVEMFALRVLCRFNSIISTRAVLLICICISTLFLTVLLFYMFLFMGMYFVLCTTLA